MILALSGHAACCPAKVKHWSYHLVVVGVVKDVHAGMSSSFSPLGLGLMLVAKSSKPRPAGCFRFPATVGSTRAIHGRRAQADDAAADGYRSAACWLSVRPSGCCVSYATFVSWTLASIIYLLLARRNPVEKTLDLHTIRQGGLAFCLH